MTPGTTSRAPPGRSHRSGQFAGSANKIATRQHARRGERHMHPKQRQRYTWKLARGQTRVTVRDRPLGPLRQDMEGIEGRGAANKSRFACLEQALAAEHASRRVWVAVTLFGLGVVGWGTLAIPAARKPHPTHSSCAPRTLRFRDRIGGRGRGRHGLSPDATPGYERPVRPARYAARRCPADSPRTLPPRRFQPDCRPSVLVGSDVVNRVSRNRMGARSSLGRRKHATV